MTQKLLKHASAAERLAMVLEEFQPEEIAGYGRTAGLTPIRMQQAIAGRLNATIPYLRLAAAMHYDPTEAGTWPIDQPMPIGDFDFVMLAMGLRMRRILSSHTTSQAAKAMDIGLGLVARFERGDALAIGPTMKVCAYVQHHPMALIRQPERIGKYRRDLAAEVDVSRETMQPAGDRDAAPLAAAVHDTNLS
jgi:hypothetical protein